LYNQPHVKKIILIGAGNVATHLALALKESGHEIVQVYSRTEGSARSLANRLSIKFTTDINEISDNADLYLVAVKDDVIQDIANQLKVSNGLIVHTSGSVEMEVFKETSENYGVFYPLQTFSKNLIEGALPATSLQWNKNVPICIESNTKSNEEILSNLAASISDNVHGINSQQRKILHLAAVFCCTFSNHMYAIAEEILKKEDLPFDLLNPLITETANKIKNKSPKEVQTGPASREDQKIMEKHLRFLSDSPTYGELYKLISKSIIESK